MSIDFSTKEIRNRITDWGCFRPNCKKTIWIRNQYAESWETDDNHTEAYISIPYNQKVLQRREISLADFSNLMADCGSYLGLLLGASVLSLTDFLIEGFKKLCRNIKEWFLSHQIQQNIKTENHIV